MADGPSKGASGALDVQSFGDGTGGIENYEGRSEGVFHPKAPDVEQLRLQEASLSFESNIKASIVHFHTAANYFVRGTPTIQQLLDKGTPAEYMARLEDNNPSENPDLRWIHLPANNMSWVESIVTRIYSEPSRKPRAEAGTTSEMSEELPSKAQAPFEMIGKNAEVVKDPDDSFKASMLLRSELWEKRQWQDPVLQKSAQGRFLRPLYSRISASYTRALIDEEKMDQHEGLFSVEDAKTNSVLFMPYVHWEEVDMYLLRNKCLDWMLRQRKPEEISGPPEDVKAKPSMNVRALKLLQKKPEKSPGLRENVKATSSGNAVAWKSARLDTNMAWDREIMGKYQRSMENLTNDAKLVFAYVHEARPLHVRRTLDQSYYYPLPDADVRKRDLDQVLYRHTNKFMDMKEKSRILMVDQLWMWIVDEPGRTKTVLTAFPHRWIGNPVVARVEVTDVYNKIFSALCTGAAVTSVVDLSCLVIDKCSSLFHPCVGESDHSLDYLEVFAVSIARLADAQTQQANEFSMHSRRLVALQDRKQELSEATLRERLFRKPSSHAKTPKGNESRLQESNPEQGVKPIANATAQPQNSKSLSQEDQEAAEWADWFTSKTKQDLKHSNPLKDLSGILESGTSLGIGREIEKEMNALVNVTAENDSLKEIKDILDELNSLSHVFQQQVKIMNDVVASNTPSKSTSHPNDLNNPTRRPLTKYEGDDDFSKAKEKNSSEGLDGAPEVKQDTAKDVRDKYALVLSTLCRREQDIENLKMKAERVYDAICDLLDLKQKQASVSEAYSARQAAAETTRQGRTILLFTVVTIIFMPLSFIAAIYSMNAKEINGNARPIKKIYQVMFPATVGVVIISLIFAFNAHIWWFLVGVLTWKRQRKARKDGSSRMSTGKPATTKTTTKSDTARTLTHTDTTMSGATPSAMQDHSDEKGSRGIGSLANWVRRGRKPGRGKQNQEAGDEESNDMEKAVDS